MKLVVIMLFLLAPALLKAQVVLTGAGGVVLANTEGNILTSSCGSFSVSDVDGNSYNTVSIGNQCWLEKNLATTKYSNGDLIGTTTTAATDITGLISPKYQWAYSGVEANVGVYGRLYTWYAITDSRNVCPTGWHVPSDGEWTTLSTFLGGEGVAGGKLKETGTAHWSAPNTSATNLSGFSSVPGGYRYDWGVFRDMGSIGAWWSSSSGSSSEGWYREIHSDASSVYRGVSYKDNGFSVRCLRD